MPRIIVTADPLAADVSEQPAVLLDEQVRSVHLSTGHAAAQLVERLAWAVSDAENAESARSAARATARRPTRGARRTSRSRTQRVRAQ
jgi:hypothetical protein